jgi:hypothetical protein
VDLREARYFDAALNGPLSNTKTSGSSGERSPIVKVVSRASITNRTSFGNPLGASSALSLAVTRYGFDRTSGEKRSGLRKLGPYRITYRRRASPGRMM